MSDGDSKTYDNLVQNKVYGETEIKKEECVNHVAKRMGTALNNLVAQGKAQKDSISGKGKLTKDKIIKIQNYYGRAIKDNSSDVVMMKKEYLPPFTIYAPLTRIQSMFITHLEIGHGAFGKGPSPKVKPLESIMSMKRCRLLLALKWYQFSTGLLRKSFSVGAL